MAGSCADGGDRVAQRLDLAPDQGGVVERIGHRRSGGQQRAHAPPRPFRQRRELQAAALRLVGAEPGVAARAREDGQSAVAAGPRAAGRRAPWPARAGRGRRAPTPRRPPRRARGRRRGRRRRAPVCAAAALAPAAEAPIFRTATPMPASMHVASASHRRAPSPSASRNSATERTPSLWARARSQSVASTTAWLPHDTTVCRRRPRPAASALTATLPLCEISATGPGSRGTKASPHSAARACRATIPSQLGPHTGQVVAQRRQRAAAPRAPRRRRRLAEAGPVDHGAAAAARAGLFDRPRGRPRRGSRRRPRRPARAGRRRSVRRRARGRGAGSGARPTRGRAKPMRLRLRSVSSA